MSARALARFGRTAVVVVLAIVIVAAASILVANSVGAGSEEPKGVYAEIRIHEPRPKLLFDTDSRRDRDPEEYRRTMARLVKGPLTLLAAMRDPKVAQSPLIREHPHPIEWLEDALEVELIGTEFIRVSLPGHRSAEAAGIVNSVVEAFMDEVVDDEERNRRKRLVDLEKAYAEITYQIATIRKSARRATEAMNAERSQLPLLDVAAVRQEYTRLRLQELKLRAALAAERDRSVNAASPEDDSSDAAEPRAGAGAGDTLHQRLQVITRQALAIAEEMQSVERMETAISSLSIDLQDHELKLRRYEKLADTIGEKMDKLNIELDSPIGIELYRKAEPRQPGA